MKKIKELLDLINHQPTDLPAPLLAMINSYSLNFENNSLPPEHFAFEEKSILDQIIHWYNQKVPDKVNIIPKEVGTRFFSLDNSAKIKSLDTSIDTTIKEITRMYSRIHQLMAADLRGLREERLRLLGLFSVDLTERLNEILEDPFWTYVGEKEKGALVFQTPPITIIQKDEFLGLDLRVPMGQFKAKLSLDGLSVHPDFFSEHKNVVVNGHCHPHLSTSGGVCWGTAHHVYTTGMKEMRFKDMFIALRSILENYNPESPYVELYRFAMRLNILDLSKFTIQYRLCEETDSEWINESELPEDFCKDKNLWETADDVDEDGYESIRMESVFRRYILELGVFDEDSRDYYVTKTGEFKLWPQQ